MTRPGDRRADEPEAEAPAKGVGDAPMRAAIVSVFGCGMCFVVVATAVYGFRAGLGVLLGAVLATLNLWIFARVAQAFVSRAGNTAPWAVIAVMKLLLLFGGVWFVLKTEVVSGLALAAGYGALPFGVTFASLFGPAPSELPPALPPGSRPRRSKQSARRSKNVIKRARPSEERNEDRNDEPED
jgi:hypothetical protein